MVAEVGEAGVDTPPRADDAVRVVGVGRRARRPCPFDADADVVVLAAGTHTHGTISTDSLQTHGRLSDHGQSAGSSTGRNLSVNILIAFVSLKQIFSCYMTHFFHFFDQSPHAFWFHICNRYESLIRRLQCVHVVCASKTRA